MSLVPQSVEVSEQVLSAVRTAALDYVEGYVTGDPVRHERCYHPEALKRRLIVEEDSEVTVLEVITPRMMVDYAAAGLSVDEEAEFEVKIDAIDFDLAAVRVYSTNWIDYLHIVKARGEWRILHAAWGTRDADRV